MWVAKRRGATRNNISPLPRPSMAMSYRDPLPAVHGSVLVLENDVDLGPLLRDVLTMAGYDVFLAQSSSEALAQLSATSMAAAVLEWSAPDGSGEVVADHLLAHRIPYVVASGSIAQPVLPARHLWAPFLPKPYTITDLITAVESSRGSGVPVEVRPASP